jgi:hypothetical protein
MSGTLAIVTKAFLTGWGICSRYRLVLLAALRDVILRAWLLTGGDTRLAVMVWADGTVCASG